MQGRDRLEIQQPQQVAPYVPRQGYLKQSGPVYRLEDGVWEIVLEEVDGRWIGYRRMQNGLVPTDAVPSDQVELMRVALQRVRPDLAELFRASVASDDNAKAVGD